MPPDGLVEPRWPCPPPDTPEALRWAFLWSGAVGGLGVLDAWRNTKHDGSTFSEVNRALFAVHTTPGRLLFLAAWAAGTVAYARHILK